MIPNRCMCRQTIGGRPWVCVAPRTHSEGRHYFVREPRVPGVTRS